jgi:pimeloyl-ACP methyl ester carboxylesterase
MTTDLDTRKPFGMKRIAPPAWRESTVRAAGLQLATFEAGSTAPGAPSVVLLHGLGHWSQAAWSRLAPELDPSMRYVAFDLPGFGASEKPDVRYDLPFFVATLHAAFAALRLDAFALVGHSLGGAIAAHYAAAYPAQVTRLALLAPAGFAYPARYFVYALAGGWARWAFTRRPSRRFVTRQLRRSVVDAAALDPATVERTVELSQDVRVRRAFAAVYSGGIAAFAHRRELRTGLSRYRGPVFCAWGIHDRFVRVAALREVLRAYPEARTLLLERSGHLAMVEQPAELGAELRDFLR